MRVTTLTKLPYLYAILEVEKSQILLLLKGCCYGKLDRII
jgi:hypothetical protein